MTASEDIQQDFTDIGKQVGFGVNAILSGDTQGTRSALDAITASTIHAIALVNGMTPTEGMVTDLPTTPFVVSPGQTVNTQFHVSGGTAPYHWILSNNWPAGLSLSSDGLLSGVVDASIPSGSEFIGDVMVTDSGETPAFATGTLDFKVE